MPSLRVRYQTVEFGDVDIHVRSLKDNQQFQDPEGVAEGLGISSATWPLFGILWASGRVLADVMFEHDIEGLRILEVGCGLGLSSLILNQRHADITATDYHPEVGAFLQANTTLNEADDIPFIRTGWDDADSGHGVFDLIIGSDLLYESSHATSLSGFINQHASPTCEVIIVDPGRGESARFSKKMATLGFSHSAYKPETSYLKERFKGKVLNYQRVEA